MKLWDVGPSIGPYSSCVNLGYTKEGIKRIPEEARNDVWMKLLMHISGCETSEESVRIAEEFLAEYFKEYVQ